MWGSNAVDESRISVIEAPAEQAPSSSSAVRSRADRSAPPARLNAVRKRSLQLSLVLISAAALGGCGNLESGDNLSRDVYANMEACKADWGTPGDCEEIDSTRSATGTRSFYGPRYYSRSGSYGYSTSSRPGSRSAGTVSSSPKRSGFGASGSRHSSSSSHSSGG